MLQQWEYRSLFSTINQVLIILSIILKEASGQKKSLLKISTEHGSFVLPLQKNVLCFAAQSCPTLSNPLDCGLQGSSVRGIFHESILEWVSISYSRVSSQPRDQIQVSCVSCIAGKFFTTEPPGKPILSLQKIKSQESLDSFLSFPPDIKIVPENFLLMLLYQHLFHLSIIFHFHKLLLPHTWILELHFPPIPVFSFSSKHSILLPDQFSQAQSQPYLISTKLFIEFSLATAAFLKCQ